MNKKLSTYGLIAGVVFIWGTIIFKVVNGLEDDAPALTTVVYETPQMVSRERDTSNYVLKNTYRDPFLGKVVRKRKTNEVTGRPIRKSKQRIKKPKEPEKQVDWSFIEYNGNFVNRDKKSITAMLKIHDRNYLGISGDVIQEVSINEIFDDSIQVSYQGQNKMIQRN